MNFKKIPTYVINLKSRADRKSHILNEFSRFKCFHLTIVEGLENSIGAIGLWNTIKQIVNTANENDDYILICEDDHEFTDTFSEDSLRHFITLATRHQADIMLGGVSSVKSLFKVEESFIWIEEYTGNQFIIIFSKFFESLLKADFTGFDTADNVISKLSSRKFLIYPFISVQKDFGYSDVTVMNNQIGLVPELFKSTSESIRYILDRQLYYGYVSNIARLMPNEYEGISFPISVINVRHSRWKNILETRFLSNHKEFYIESIFDTRTTCANRNLFDWIQQLLRELDKDNNFVVLCDYDFSLTKSYDVERLCRNIIEAHDRGADLVLGGVSDGYGHALPITDDLVWINSFSYAPFLIIFQSLFDVILNSPPPIKKDAFITLSDMTSNKFVIHPFISEVSANNTESESGIYQKLTNLEILSRWSSSRLLSIREEFTKHALQHLS